MIRDVVGLLLGDIAKLALAGDDKEAVRTLEVFYEYQILCAQQLAVALQATSVMLLGDNQVCLRDQPSDV